MPFGFFSKDPKKELADPLKRRERIEQAFEDSRRIASEGASTQEIRKPLVELAELFISANQDAGEVYQFCLRAVPNDSFWRQAYLGEVLKRPRLTKEDIHALESEAIANPANIAIWRRLFLEGATHADATLIVRSYENCVMALRSVFPSPGVTRWADEKTQDEALRVFRQALDGAAQRIAAMRRDDPQAQVILALKATYDGEPLPPVVKGPVPMSSAGVPKPTLSSPAPPPDKARMSSTGVPRPPAPAQGSDQRLSSAGVPRVAPDPRTSSLGVPRIPSPNQTPTSERLSSVGVPRPSMAPPAPTDFRPSSSGVRRPAEGGSPLSPLVGLAEAARARGETGPEALALGLQAVLADPSRDDLKLWTGGLLVQQPGCEDEGFEMIRRVLAEKPSSEEAQRELVSAFKVTGRVGESDLAMLARYCRQEPEDQRAKEVLADYYADREDVSEAGIAAYKAAAPASPQRGRYLRMLVRALSDRSNMTTAMDIFNDIRRMNGEENDVILPLAAAYAEFGRTDVDAIKVYRRAIELGSLKPEVHDLLCRHLYMREKSAPDSVTAFKATAKRFPKCIWARLGVIDHLLNSGDPVRALEECALVLRDEPRDLEAQKYAAHALAANFSRPQMRIVAQMTNEVAMPVLEKALALQRDAAPLVEACVRRRLEAGRRDAETARLLAEVVRRNPDAFDLKLARADVLSEIGDAGNAEAIYRELLERHRARSLSSGGAVIPPSRLRDVLATVIESALQAPGGPRPSDLDIFLEACADPGAPGRWVLAAATLMIDNHIDHPMRMPILERAVNADAGNERLEMALVLARAQKGNPRPALRFALRRLEQGSDDANLVLLVRTTASIVTPDLVGEEVVNRLHQLLLTRKMSHELNESLVELCAASREPSRDAIDYFESLLRIIPASIAALRGLAKCYEAAGQVTRAADIYAKAAVGEVMDDQTALRVARLNAKMQKIDRDAIALAERALALAPDDVDLLTYVIATRLESGRYDDAEELSRTVLRSGDRAANERLLAVIENSARLATSNPLLLLLHTQVCIKLGFEEQALESLARLQPHHRSLYAQLLEAYSDLLAIAPSNPRALVERGLLYRMIGHTDEAIADLERAHAIAPDNAGVIGEYAELLGQTLRAERSSDAGKWSRLGELLFQMGDSDAAMDACVNAIEANPTHEGALLLLAQVQLETRALDLCHATLRRMPKTARNFSLLQRLARAYEDQDDPETAAEVLTEALEFAGANQRDVVERLRELNRRRAELAREDRERSTVLSALSKQAQSRYELREELGRGTMGLVFKAYDKELDEIVVLKILPDEFSRDAEMVARFRREAKAARKLAHPNIVRIHDIGEDSGRKHISMEYVSGGDLKQALAANGGPFPVAEATRFVREIARALVHAHGEGVLHRDIKPANVLLTRARKVKLSDFGIAALFTDAASGRGADPGATPVGQGADAVAGTPLYMSPEQFSGANLTPASDIYSLGVVYYELLAGKPPFSTGSLSYHHQYSVADPIDGIPPKLMVVIDKAIAKRPADRIQTARELLDILDAIGIAGTEGRTSPRGPLDMSNEITPVTRRPG